LHSSHKCRIAANVHLYCTCLSLCSYWPPSCWWCKHHMGNLTNPSSVWYMRMWYARLPVISSSITGFSLIHSVLCHRFFFVGLSVAYSVDFCRKICFFLWMRDPCKSASISELHLLISQCVQVILTFERNENGCIIFVAAEYSVSLLPLPGQHMLGGRSLPAELCWLPPV